MMEHGRHGAPMLIAPVPAAWHPAIRDDEWVEVADPTFGRYWRPSAQWHERRIKEQVAFGISEDAARRHQLNVARRYEPC